MTISTNKTFEFNVSKIITLAFKMASIVNIEQECNAEQLKFGKEQFDLITQTVEAEAAFQRMTGFELVDVTAQETEYMLPDDVVDVIENAQLLADTDDPQNGSYYEIPIRRVRMSEWSRIANKRIQGIPVMYYDERTADGIKIHLYPIPSFGKALRFQVQRLRARNDLNATPDFERWWADYFVKEIALRVAVSSGLEMSRINMLQGLASAALMRCASKSVNRGPSQIMVSHKVRV